jgi:hypothetical protein
LVYKIDLLKKTTIGKYDQIWPFGKKKKKGQ